MYIYILKSRNAPLKLTPGERKPPCITVSPGDVLLEEVFPRQLAGIWQMVHLSAETHPGNEMKKPET